jgi:serine/threonine-protein kinase
VTPEQFARLRTIFQDALDQPPALRRAWLAQACGGEAALQRDAESLLAAHDTAGDFLDAPAQVDPEDLDALIPGSRLGDDYQINGILGRGGMGIVYLAHDYRLGRRVALKALPASVASPELRERLRREARAAATISHRAVATVFALEEIDGDLYIATEYVPGHTLSSEIAQGPIAAERAATIAVEVAGALAAAHQAGVVHRDLKPDNVLIDSGGVKVVDFGIAHIEGPEATRLTKAGAMLGTPAYMAPEQLLGGAVDARADIYAFGVMLSEMLTGRHPLHGDGNGTSGTAPAAFAEIVNRCLQTDPQLRFANGRELLAALESGGPEGPPLRSGQPGRGGPGSAHWWWAFHQVAAAVVYGAMVYPAWLARGAIGGQAGRAVFIVTLATVIVSVTLRLHLWFTSRSYPEQLDWARRRNGPWLRTCDWLFALTLIAAGLVVGDTPLGVTLVSVGIGAGAVFLVVEPVTTRAAFRN